MSNATAVSAVLFRLAFLATLCASTLLPAAEPLYLEGYTYPLSVRPGEEVGLHVSTNADTFSAEIARVGATDELIWTANLPGREYPAGDGSGRPGQAAMEGCDWPAAVRVSVPPLWKSGLYRVVLRARGESRGGIPSGPFHRVMMTSQPPRFFMFFVVRAARPGSSARILLQLASNTYQAYNNWGGSSLYSGPRHPRVSFRRPMNLYPWASPATWELPLLRWAERCGYAVDVCTNLDLEMHPEILPHYRLVLSVGHDEYWSAGMRDSLERFVANGGNCAFFSGNTCCWQVRVEDEGRALVCYKRSHDSDPASKTLDRQRLTTLWSDPILRRPENLLTGVGFVYGGYNGVFGCYQSGPGEGEYTVHRPDHWLFVGTGLRRGQTFGKEASIAGYEMDGCEMVWQNGLPVPTGRDGTPRDLEILATAPGRWAPFDGSLTWCRTLRQGLAPLPGLELPKDFAERDGAGVLGVYSRGGTVVTAGSTDWANGLAIGDPVVERITRNIFARLAGVSDAAAALAGSKPAPAPAPGASAEVFPDTVAGRPLPTARNFPPKPPQESLRAFRPRPGFKVELMAAEPAVMSPVDIAWGPDGKLWVVEMPDYPLGIDGKGKPGGRVRILECSKSDGIYDKSTVFLDNLPFPSGCMPWRKGVIVTCAPEVFYAEDTNGDGRADLRKPLFWGFGEGNQQHRVNHPRWGLDNWVHLANGDGGAGANGVIKSIAKPTSQMDIRGRDIRIRPDDGDLDVVTGQAQYGRNRDDWGNWFGCNNNDPSWLYAVDDHYMRRNPYVAAPPSRVDLTADRAAFPVGWVVTHHTPGEPCPPLGQPGAWTCLCGFMIYRDELLGTEVYGNGFFADAVYNAVSRAVIRPRGVLFSSQRAPGEERAEFLVSADPWFRPATLRTGPDGALWVVDMYRFVIEHPQWINQTLQATLDLRLGHDRGRLWRVYPAGTKPRPIPRLDELDSLGLVAALDSPSGWQRDMAHQMLIWRADPSAVKPLEDLAIGGKRPLARLHALCALEGMKALRAPIVVRALGEAHSGVRRHAIRLSEPLLASHPALGEGLLKLLDDEDPQVRMQLSYSLGEWKDPRAGRALGQLALRHADDPYLMAAVMSSAIPHIGSMLAEINAASKEAPARAVLGAGLTKLSAEVKAAPNVASELAARRRQPAEQLADKVLGLRRTPGEVQKALDKCSPALTLPGEPARGATVFVEATCSTCHRLGDVGTEIGPDLTTLTDRSSANLVVAVIDPNRAVVAKFLEHIAVTTDGQTFRGMLMEETSNQITLVDAAGKSQVILRKDLDELVCTGRSHMPEKLEEKLTPSQMADLFAFVRTMKPVIRQPPQHTPVLVKAEAGDVLRLRAAAGQIHGAKITFDAEQSCLVWHAGQPQDHVAWTAEVPKAGAYEVSIETAQIPENANNPFAIESPVGRLTGTLPSTGGWKKWQRNAYGKLNLAAGRQTIVLRPNGPIKSELSDLREICLVPVTP